MGKSFALSVAQRTEGLCKGKVFLKNAVKVLCSASLDQGRRVYTTPASARTFLMWKSLPVGITAALIACAGLAADLSVTENRWLKGVWPVVTFARAIQLPLDIVVQPQPTPGAAPLAMAFVGGRCKLVFSMRGNPEAHATLDRIAPDLLDAALELMAAHELGHCKRYLDGAWYSLPAGFARRAGAGRSQPELRSDILQMHATRREEGFADLVGLAWTRQRHPEKYEALYKWLVGERSKDLIPGSHHDTLVWLRQAREGTALDNKSIFSGATRLWTEGLGVDE